MIFLWIFLVLVAIVLFLLLLPINLVFDFHENAQVYLRILWIRLDSKKFIDSFFSEKQNKDSGLKPKRAKSSEKGRKKSPYDLMGFAEFLIHITGVLGSTLRDFFSKSKVHLKELQVSVGTDDAAKTALLCSTVIQAANGLCALLYENSHLVCDSDHLSISPDFTSESSRFSLHLVLSCPVIHLIGVYLRANIRFFE